MSSIDVLFSQIHSSIILNLFDPRKSLLNKCLSCIITHKINVDKLNSDLEELIQIYKYCLRLKDVVKTRSSFVFRQVNHKLKFLVNCLMIVIGAQVEESILQLVCPIVDLMSKHGTVLQRCTDEFVVQDVNNPKELLNQINLFLSKSVDFVHFKANLSSNCLWIEYPINPQ